MQTIQEISKYLPQFETDLIIEFFIGGDNEFDRDVFDKKNIDSVYDIRHIIKYEFVELYDRCNKNTLLEATCLLKSKHLFDKFYNPEYKYECDVDVRCAVLFGNDQKLINTLKKYPEKHVEVAFEDAIKTENQNAINILIKYVDRTKIANTLWQFGQLGKHKTICDFYEMHGMYNYLIPGLCRKKRILLMNHITKKELVNGDINKPNWFVIVRNAIARDNYDVLNWIKSFPIQLDLPKIAKNCKRFTENVDMLKFLVDNKFISWQVVLEITLDRQLEGLIELAIINGADISNKNFVETNLINRLLFLRKNRDAHGKIRIGSARALDVYLLPDLSDIVISCLISNHDLKNTIDNSLLSLRCKGNMYRSGLLELRFISTDPEVYLQNYIFNKNFKLAEELMDEYDIWDEGVEFAIISDNLPYVQNLLPRSSHDEHNVLSLSWKHLSKNTILHFSKVWSDEDLGNVIKWSFSHHKISIASFLIANYPHLVYCGFNGMLEVGSCELFDEFCNEMKITGGINCYIFDWASALICACIGDNEKIVDFCKDRFKKMNNSDAANAIKTYMRRYALSFEDFILLKKNFDIDWMQIFIDDIYLLTYVFDVTVFLPVICDRFDEWADIFYDYPEMIDEIYKLKALAN